MSSEKLVKKRARLKIIGTKAKEIIKYNFFSQCQPLLHKDITPWIPRFLQVREKLAINGPNDPIITKGLSDCRFPPKHREKSKPGI